MADNAIDILKTFEAVDGFMAAGLFGDQGELLENTSRFNMPGLEDLCVTANEALNKSQDLSDALSTGDIQILHITVPEFNILVGPFTGDSIMSADKNKTNYNGIFLVLASEGNVALGRVKIGSMINKRVKSE